MRAGKSTRYETSVSMSNFIIFFSLTLAIYLYLGMKSFLMTRLKLTYLCDITFRHTKVMVHLNDCKTETRLKQFGETTFIYRTHNFFLILRQAFEFKHYKIHNFQKQTFLKLFGMIEQNLSRLGYFLYTFYTFVIFSFLFQFIKFLQWFRCSQLVFAF